MDVDIAWEDGQLRELVWIMWNNGQFVKIWIIWIVIGQCPWKI